jgi:putative MATE family efflux protein
VLALAKRKEVLNDLTQGPVLRQLLLFSLPLMLAYALQAVYNVVDMIVVGQFVGATGLSAVGIGGQIQNLLLFIGMGLGSAAQILVSQQVGAGDYDGLQHSIGTSLSCICALGVVAGGLCAFFCDGILALLNTPTASLADARAYCLVCCSGMLFIYGYNGVCAILRGMGESRLPMYFVAIAAVVNVILDLVFVAGCAMGAVGAALATVIAQACAFLFALVCLYRRRAAFHFDFCAASFVPRANRVRALFRLGLPLIVQSVMINVSVMYVNANINVYGVAASAVDGVGNKLNTISFTLTNALGVATSAMMGQCFGARNHARLKQVFWYCTALSMTVFVVLAAVSLIFPEQLFRLFTSDTDVIAYARDFMRIAVLYYLANCSMLAPYSLLEGTGSAGLSLIIGLLDGVVARLGLCWLLGRWIGLYGFWIGSALAGFVTTLGGSIYYFSGKWKTKKLVLESTR